MQKHNENVSLLDNKTALWLLSGMTLLLTATATAFAALASSIVLLLSTVICGVLSSLLGKRVPMFTLMVLSSGAVSALQLVLNALIRALPFEALPVALVGTSLFVFMQAHTVSEMPVSSAAMQTLISGASFSAVLLVAGCVREVLGASSLFGVALFGGRFDAITVFSKPVGAFFIASAVSAGVIAIARRVRK